MSAGTTEGGERRRWVTIQASALCVECDWYFHPGEADYAKQATREGRKHHEATGHGVHVSKGALLIFESSSPDRPGAPS